MMPDRSQHYRRLLAVFGANLQTMRKQRGWTQEQAAACVGLHARHYQKLEAGEVNFTARTIARVAYAFRVSFGQLLVPGALCEPDDREV
ncbi:MAG: hypothetical protein A2341_07575 [Deltaproteobacteria bacterium RIFOXYB12_FULL_58_9]|nr:MAG: hypothetical protein A2341_07575 [Deltaproteobacteria bacterium RIFOXYB12_FULL_58_9]